MSEIAIKVEGLGKRYKIGTLQQRHDTLRDQLAHLARKRFSRNGNHSSARSLSSVSTVTPDIPSDILWALKDISFEVKRGEVVGIIGRNGAGKSTLLKILSRITDPTEGYADISGRIGSLLEVGTGFHPELTGRENIYLNGSILGMKRAEITRKFDEIVAFAEVEKFIDTPVKHYSSGMYVRLAFAVAAHMETEILLVDEVLAVGDAAFQKKCLGKMGDVAKEGRTVLFVSHSMGAVSSLCDRTVWFDAGKIQAAGPTAQIVTSYLAEVFQNTAGDLEKLRSPGLGKEARILDVKLVTNDGKNVLFGQPLKYRLIIWSDSDLTNISIGSSVFNSSGRCVGSLITKQMFSIASNQQLVLHLTVSESNLAPGSYYAGFSLGRGGRSGSRRDLDAIIGKPAFQVLPISGSQDNIQDWSPLWGDIVFEDVELAIEPPWAE